MINTTWSRNLCLAIICSSVGCNYTYMRKKITDTPPPPDPDSRCRVAPVASHRRLRSPPPAPRAIGAPPLQCRAALRGQLDALAPRVGTRHDPHQSVAPHHLEVAG